MLPPALQEQGVSSTALPQVSLGHCCAICAHFTQHNTLHAATRTNPALFTLTWPGFASVASPAAVRTSPPVPAGGTRNLGQGEQHWGLFISALTLGCLRASSPEGQLREKGHLSAAFLFQSPATPHCHGSVAATQGQGGGWGLMGRAAKELLLLQNRGEVGTAVMERYRKLLVFVLVLCLGCLAEGQIVTGCTPALPWLPTSVTRALTWRLAQRRRHPEEGRSQVGPQGDVGSVLG